MCGIGPDAAPCGDDNPYNPDQWDQDGLWDNDAEDEAEDDDIIAWAATPVCNSPHLPQWPSPWVARHRTRHP